MYRLGRRSWWVVFLFAPGCNGNGAGPEPPRIADVFASKADFEAARDRVGSATGNAFSGTYQVTFRGGQFSDDCTVDFVREQDFYVNTGASDAEIAQTLQTVFPDATLSIQIIQIGGRISVDSDGDGVEAAPVGSIDADGTMQALFGAYENKRNFFGAVYNGRIDGDDIRGEFLFRLVLLDDPVVPGSCSFGADFDGQR